MKKLSLEETWRLCLEMWKWIAEEWEKDNTKRVAALKQQWLKEHGFENVSSSCFFCAYAKSGCGLCPARLVEENFLCDDSEHDYLTKPVEFYHKIVSLHETWLRKEQENERAKRHS